MTDAAVQRDLGRLEAQVQSIGNAVAHLTNKIENLDAKVDGVDKTLSEARGGWKMLMLVGGAAGAVGSALTWIAQHLSVLKP